MKRNKFLTVALLAIGATLFGSFMNATKVEQNIGDEKRIIKLKDAYEQDAQGIIKLKKGIDLEWSHVPIYHAIDAEEKRAQDQMQTAIGLVSSITTLNSIHKNINTQLNRLAKKKNYGSRSDIALTGLMQISSQS